jgi:signal peptide peptidase SppA
MDEFYRLVYEEIIGAPWAIMPNALNVLLARARALAPLPEAVTPRAVSAPVGIAHIPIRGVITPRANMFTAFFGGTSLDGVTQSLRQALAEPQVSAIVLDIDSPGGSVYGVGELAAEIYRARGQKPILAVANSLAASAAYWLAAAADVVSVTPSGEVGSIGVYAAHDDYSKALEQDGVKRTMISAGRYKVEGNPWEPLSEEARAAIQKRVDEYYDAFVAAVALYRGTTDGRVRNGYGEGRVVGAQEAAGTLADHVETFDAVLSRAVRIVRRKAQDQSSRKARAAIAGL